LFHDKNVRIDKKVPGFIDQITGLLQEGARSRISFYAWLYSVNRARHIEVVRWIYSRANCYNAAIPRQPNRKICRQSITSLNDSDHPEIKDKHKELQVYGGSVSKW
jgi:hypothetical protein